MTAFVDSFTDLVVSLGGSIVTKATVALLITLLAVRLARQRPASIRHLVLTAGVAVLGALPIAAVVVPPVPVDITPVAFVFEASVAESPVTDEGFVGGAAAYEETVDPTVPRWTLTPAELLTAVWLGLAAPCPP